MVENKDRLELELERVWDSVSRIPECEGTLVKIGEEHYDVRLNGVTVEDGEFLKDPYIESLISVARTVMHHYGDHPGKAKKRDREQIYPLYIKLSRQENQIISEVRW